MFFQDYLSSISYRNGTLDTLESVPKNAEDSQSKRIDVKTKNRSLAFIK